MAKKAFSIFHERVFLCLTLAFLVNLALKTYQISFQSFWFDELATLSFSNGVNSLDFFSHYYNSPDYHPPLYYFIINLITSFFGSTEFSVRLFSAVVSSLSVYPLFRAARLISNSKIVAYISVLFYSFSGANLYYAQEARSYSLTVFLVLLVLVYGFELVTHRKRKNIFIAKYIVSGVALLYTNYIGLPFLALLIILLVFVSKLRKLDLKVILWPSFLVFVAYLPWFPIFFSQLGGWSMVKAYNENPNILVYFKKMFDFSYAYTPYWVILKQMVSISVIRNISYVIYALTLLISALANLKQYKKVFEKIKMASYTPLAPIFMIVVTLSAVFLKDLSSPGRFFYERNLIFLTPFFYVFYAQVICSVRSKILVCTLTVIPLSLFIFQPFINQNYYNQKFKTDYRAFTRYVENYSLGHDLPIFVSCGNPGFYAHYIKNKKEMTLHDARSISLFLDNIKKLPHSKFGVMSIGCSPNRGVFLHLMQEYAFLKEVKSSFGSSLIIFSKK